MMSLDATILALPGLKSYWKLDESAGAIAADQLGASNGGYAGATLAQAGHIYGESNGGNAVLTGSGTYIGLGRCGSMVSDCITAGVGMTFGFWFKDNGIAASAGPHYVCGGYQLAGPKGGWELFITNSAFGGGSATEGFTLRFLDDAGNVCSRQFKRYSGQSPLCDGYWHFIVVRIRIPVGVSTASGVMSVTVDGLPYKLSAAWSDVAADVTIGTATDFDAGTQLTLGARYIQGSGASTAIPALFQRAFRCTGLLIDEEIRQVFAAGTFTPPWGAPDPEAYFNFTDITTLFQDTAGTVPVTAAGQTVERVNAAFGTLYLQAVSTATAPIWNGEDLSFPNQTGSGSARRGLELKGMGASTHPKHYRSSAVGVVGTSAAYVYGSTASMLIYRKASAAAWGGLAALNDVPGVLSQSVTRTPTSSESMGVVKSLPSFGLVAISSGSNGSGAENDGTDFCFVQDDQVRGNAPGGGSAQNGSYWESLTSSGWVGCQESPANAGSYAYAFSGRMKALAFYARPLHPTTEAPVLRSRAQNAFPSLQRAGKTWVFVTGDSISSSINDLPGVGGYMVRMGDDFDENTVVVNAAIGNWYMSQQTGRINSPKWFGDKPMSAPSVVISFCGTNDIINAGGGSQANEATLEARIVGHIAQIRAIFGADVPIIVIAPRAGFSNAVAPVGASTALYVDYMNAHPELYTRFIESGSYSNLDGTHPDPTGFQQIADLLRGVLIEEFPDLFGIGGVSRTFRTSRTQRLARV